MCSHFQLGSENQTVPVLSSQGETEPKDRPWEQAGRPGSHPAPLTLCFHKGATGQERGAPLFSE